MTRRILLALSALVAAISTVTHWAVLLAAVVLYAVTVVLAMRATVPRRGGDADQTGAAVVLSVVTGIVVLHGGASTVAVVEVAVLLAVLHALHLLRHVARVLVFRRWRGAADWRNLQVGVPIPRRVDPTAGPTLAPIPAWIIAPICAVYDAADFVYLLLGILCLVLMIISMVPISVAVLANLRMPSDAVRLKALTTSLRELKPEILVHFNARATSSYAINEWVGVLEELNRTHRVVILTVDREPWHFETIASTELPVVHLAGAEAIEYFVEQIPSLVLALYPRNTSPNKNLLRVPGLYDVYLGHGESDKAEVANPATRAFDEVWIAGDAARERFLSAGIGIRNDQLRITGRPQLATLQQLASNRQAGATLSVVYAPTWEGYYADDGYSSVESMGEQVIAALVARDDVSVTYLPHPALGTLNSRVAQASGRLVSRVARAGGRSVLAGSLQDRQAVLATADLLVTDISTDLVDFLAVDRPYVVLSPGETTTPETFAVVNPSASAGDVVGVAQLSQFSEIVQRALGADSRSRQRVSLAKRYLGDLAVPPVERFLAAVDACLGHIRQTIPARELPPEPEEPLDPEPVT